VQSVESRPRLRQQQGPAGAGAFHRPWQPLLRPLGGHTHTPAASMAGSPSFSELRSRRASAKARARAVASMASSGEVERCDPSAVGRSAGFDDQGGQVASPLLPRVPPPSHVVGDMANTRPPLRTPDTTMERAGVVLGRHAAVRPGSSPSARDVILGRAADESRPDSSGGGGHTGRRPGPVAPGSGAGAGLHVAAAAAAAPHQQQQQQQQHTAAVVVTAWAVLARLWRTRLLGRVFRALDRWVHASWAHARALQRSLRRVCAVLSARLLRRTWGGWSRVARLSQLSAGAGKRWSERCMRIALRGWRVQLRSGRRVAVSRRRQRRGALGAALRCWRRHAAQQRRLGEHNSALGAAPCQLLPTVGWWLGSRDVSAAL
jgi:hypothetical protein